MEHQTESGHADRPEDAHTPEQPGAGASRESEQERWPQPSVEIPAEESTRETTSSADGQATPSEDAIGTLSQNMAWMQDVEAFITEPPKGEDEDGFSLIPAGPVEEVNYDEGRPRGARARRATRGRRMERRAPARPAPVGAAPAPVQRRDRFPLWAAIAAAVILVLLGLLTLWIISKYHSATTENTSAPQSLPALSSQMEESGHVL